MGLKWEYFWLKMCNKVKVVGLIDLGLFPFYNEGEKLK
jgi:hypothetical protein